MLVEEVLVVVVVVVDDDEMAPPQDPKADRQPTAQYSGPLPHQYHSEQQSPKAEPAHVVVLPHSPLGLMIIVPPGSGGDVDVEVVLVVGGLVVVLELELVVDVVVGSGGGASPQRPNWAWHQRTSQ